MSGFFRDLRLLPIVLIATMCLLALKAADLLLDDKFPFTSDNVTPAESGPAIVRAARDAAPAPDSNLSWAQQMFNFPDGKTAPPAPAAPPPIAVDRSNADIVTGTVASEKKGGTKAEKGEAKSDNLPGVDDKPPADTVIKYEGTAPPSNAERQILERLQQRRQELDARARELDIRESLLKAAEKRMEGRLTELKEVESRIADETKKKNEAEAARLKSLITMYENMKAKDAAKIFDRLEAGVLLDVASQINPRQMADILAQMNPESAQRLTVDLASRAQGAAAKGGPAELPKIEGRPTTP